MKIARTVAFASLFFAVALHTAPAQRSAWTANPSAAPTPLPNATLSPRELFSQTFKRLESYPIPPYVVYTTLWHVHAYSTIGQPAETYGTLRYAIRESDQLENAATLQSDASPQIGATDGWLPRASIRTEYLGLFASILRPPTPVASAYPNGFGS